MSLNVQVKSEPRGGAKGQYQCEITDQGVTLKQRKKQFEIPVGSDVTYQGKNLIAVQLPDSRLTLTVGKFGTYQNRLTKDLAEFLAGRAHPPVVSDYKLPWYFFVLSLLPLGIPVMTLGGALPGMIGAGLAAGCFAIAQNEDWSVSARLFLAAMLVAVGYLLFFLVIGIALVSQSSLGAP